MIFYYYCIRNVQHFTSKISTNTPSYDSRTSAENCMKLEHSELKRRAAENSSKLGVALRCLLPAVVVVVPLARNTGDRVLTLLQHVLQLSFFPLATRGVRHWSQHCTTSCNEQTPLQQTVLTPDNKIMHLLTTYSNFVTRYFW